MNVLVTGGAGYIGSHTVVELQKAVLEAMDFLNPEPDPEPSSDEEPQPPSDEEPEPGPDD